MDEIKINLNKLLEFPKSVKSISGYDMVITEEDKKSIIELMKEADSSNTGNKDGYISRDELNLYSPPDKYRSVSEKASLVLREWEKQSAQAEKPQGTPPGRNQTQERNQMADIEKTIEELRVQERKKQEILNKKQQELNKSASDFATATKDRQIELTSSTTDSRGGLGAIGKIGAYGFRYWRATDSRDTKLILTDPNGQKVELENPEQYKEFKLFFEKLEIAIDNNPNNEHLILRYSCQFSSRFQ